MNMVDFFDHGEVEGKKGMPMTTMMEIWIKADVLSDWHRQGVIGIGLCYVLYFVDFLDLWQSKGAIVASWFLGSKPPRQSPDSIEAMVTLRETNISHLKIGGGWKTTVYTVLLGCLGLFAGANC